jgi:hypothetical protein
MVAVAAGSPGRRTTGTLQTKNATVGLVFGVYSAASYHNPRYHVLFGLSRTACVDEGQRRRYVHRHGLQGIGIPPMDRPRVKFGGQTGEEAEGNLTLASLIRDRRGDPALSAWEEGFLADIERLLRSHDGRITLTDKQFDRVFLIFEKLEAQEAVPVDELAEGRSWG